MSSTTRWNSPSAYIALTLVTLGVGCLGIPMLALLGLPLVVGGLVAARLVIVNATGRDALDRHMTMRLACAVGMLVVLAGAVSCARVAAQSFRAAPDPVAVRLMVSLSLMLLGPLILTLVVRRSRRPHAAGVLPYFVHWFLYGPAAFVLTFILGVIGAPFGA